MHSGNGGLEDIIGVPELPPWDPDRRLIPDKELIERDAKEGLVARFLRPLYEMGSKLRNLIACAIFASGIVASGLAMSAVAGLSLLGGCRGKYSIEFLSPDKNAVVNYHGVKIRKNRLIIPFKGKPSLSEMNEWLFQLLKGYTYEVVSVKKDLRTITIWFPSDQEWNSAWEYLINESKKPNSVIRGASLDVLQNVQSIEYQPNDPEYRPPDNWGYEDSGINNLWNSTFGGNLSLGLVDTWFGGIENLSDVTDNLVEVKRKNSVFGNEVAAQSADVALINGIPVFVYESNATGNWKIYGNIDGLERRIGTAQGFYWERNPRIASGKNSAMIVYTTWEYGDEDIGAVLLKSSSPNRWIRINQQIDGIQNKAVIKAITDGTETRFVVSWIDYNSGKAKLKLRIYSENGDPISNEILVEDVQDANQINPFIFPFENGSFEVYYASDINSQNGYDIFKRKFDWDGKALADAELVVSNTGDQLRPIFVFEKLSQDEWRKVLAYESNGEIKALIEDEQGNTLELLIDNGELGSVSVLQDSTNPNERALVFAYTKKGAKDEDAVIKAFRFDGTLLDELILNSAIEGTQTSIRSTRKDNSTSIYVWTDQRSGNPDIYARELMLNEGRLTLRPELRVDSLNEIVVQKYHGLAVASMLGGIDNEKGTAGGEFQIRAYETAGDANDLGKTMEDLLNAGEKIILCTVNIPWKGVPNKNDPVVKRILEQYAKVWENIARSAAEKNTLIVISAGNNAALDAELSTGIPTWLKNAMPTFLVCGAYEKIGSTYTVLSNSTINGIDVMAPGSARACIGFDDEEKQKVEVYGSVKGTCPAATFGALAAALLKAKYPYLTPRQLRRFLILGGELSGKLINATPAINLEKTVELIEENHPPSESVAWNLSNRVDFFDVAEINGTKFLSYSFYDDSLQKHRLFLVNNSLGEIELGEGTNPQILVKDNNLIIVYLSEDGVGYKLINPNDGRIIKEKFIVGRYDTIKLDGEEYKLEGVSPLAFKKTPLGYCGLLEFRDKVRDALFTFFVRYDFDNDKLESLGKLPKNIPYVPLLEDCWDVGELGDVHIGVFEEDTTNRVWRIYYIKRSHNGKWSMEEVGEWSMDKSLFSGSIHVKVKWEIPHIIFGQGDLGTNILSIEEFVKKSGSWKSREIIKKQVNNLSLVAAYKVKCSVDHDGRIVVTYNDSDGIHGLFPDKDGSYVEHFVPVSPHSVDRSIRTRIEGNYGNTKVVYIPSTSKIVVIKKNDY